MARYRILSLDGGGVRGAVTARLLERLEAEQPGCLARADLIAGTSIGGILALGLAYGLPPDRCRALLEDNAPLIFPRWFPYNFGWARLARHLFAALYENDELKNALLAEFGERRLADLRARVLIPAFDLDAQYPNQRPRWKAKFFHNFPGADSDGAERIVDVAMRTSAAPTYLPIYERFVDGGVVANNPSMCALAQALHRDTGKQRAEDVVVLSVGTGVDFSRIPQRDVRWGILGWFFGKTKLTGAMVGGVAGVAEYQCRQVLRDRFHRLNPAFCDDDALGAVSLDDSDSIPALVRATDEAPLADGDVPTREWLREYWMTD